MNYNEALDMLGDLEDVKDNIRRVYAHASDDDFHKGKTWYQTAYDIATLVGAGEAVKGAGMLAVTSPNCSWEQNIKIAKGQGKGIESNIAKMKAISESGKPWEYLKSSKVSAFFECIISKGLDNTVRPCIDTHALSIALGMKVTGKSEIVKFLFGKANTNKAFYRIVQNAYIDVATEYNLTPAQLQAITWVTWRRHDKKTDSKTINTLATR